MNRLLLFSFVLLIGSGCGNDTAESNNTAIAPVATPGVNSPAAVTTKTAVDSAKELLIEAQGYVKRGIIRELTGKEVNEKINPLMAQFMEIYKRMPPADTAIIYQFRIQQMRELSELQVKVQNQK